MASKKRIIDLKSKRKKQTAKDRPKEKSKTEKRDDFVSKISARYPEMSSKDINMICSLKWYNYAKADEYIYFQELFSSLRMCTIFPKDIEFCLDSLEELGLEEDANALLDNILRKGRGELEDTLKSFRDELLLVKDQGKDPRKFSSLESYVSQLLNRKDQYVALRDKIASSTEFDDIRNDLPQYLKVEIVHENHIATLREAPEGRKADKPCKYCGYDKVIDKIRQKAGFDEMSDAREMCARCKK